MAENYQRARSPEHKLERLRSIMAAADRQFHAQPYQNISLTTLAAELGWSRGNLYKYISTKEEIYLLLYLEKQRDFLDELQSASGAIVDRFTEAFTRNRDYLRYHSILSQILEQNVTVEALADFKKQSFADRESAYALIRQRRPELSDRQTAQMYMTFLYGACGLHAHTTCSPLLAEAMELIGRPITNADDFQHMLRQYLELCLAHYTPEFFTV